MSFNGGKLGAKDP